MKVAIFGECVMSEEYPARCWSCLCPLAESIQVHLTEAVLLPVCQHCWTEMPVEGRLTVAQRFNQQMLDDHQRRQTIDTLQAIEAIFREALDDWHRRQQQEPWSDG